MNTTFLKNGIKVLGRFGTRTALVISKHTPTILMGVGAVAGAGALVETAKATSKVDDIIANKNDHIEAIELCSLESPEYTEEDKRNDILKSKAIMCVDLVKVYTPAASLYIASMVCFFGGHRILAQRYAATAAALTATSKAFSGYRGNVRDELGEEADWRFLHNIKADELVKKQITDENGEVKTITVVERKDAAGRNPYDYSMYAKVFDKTNEYWRGEPSYNMLFLKSVQNQLNDKLLSRRNRKHGGHLFLNEAYEALGFDHTKAGAVVGWYIPAEGSNEDPDCDYYVDFGIFANTKNPNGYISGPATRFINGQEENIILDFNVRGNIYDLMD